ncbi:hypothetical protein V8C40DRAFT_111848 [Trichoderma camerunense]
MHLHVSCISIGQHRASLIFLFFGCCPSLVPLSACLGYLKLSLAPVPPVPPLPLPLPLSLFFYFFHDFVFLLFKLFQLNPFSGASYLPSPKTSSQRKLLIPRCCVAAPP